MDLKTLQHYAPSFDPSKYNRMPFGGEKIISTSEIPHDLCSEAQESAIEAIRAELSKKAGGKKIYSQIEALSSDSRFVTHRLMFDDVVNERAVIK